MTEHDPWENTGMHPDFSPVDINMQVDDQPLFDEAYFYHQLASVQNATTVEPNFANCVWRNTHICQLFGGTCYGICPIADTKKVDEQA